MDLHRESIRLPRIPTLARQTPIMFVATAPGAKHTRHASLDGAHEGATVTKHNLSGRPCRRLPAREHRKAQTRKTPALMSKSHEIGPAWPTPAHPCGMGAYTARQ